VSKLLTVTETIELLESLRAAVREFAAAEEKLTRDYRGKTESAQKRFEEERSAHDADLNARVNEAEASYASATASLAAKNEQRKARIARAHKASRKTALDRIENEEGRRKYQSQRGLLDTKRFRTESLAQNDATLADFNQQLAASQAGFAELEEQARGAFRGYGNLRRMVDAGSVPAAATPSGDEYQLLDQLRQLQSRTADDLSQFNQLLLPKIFRAVPLWLWIAFIVVCGAAGAPALRAAGQTAVSFPVAGGAAGVLLILVVAAYFVGRGKAQPLGARIAGELESARSWHTAAAEQAQRRHAGEIQRIEAEAQSRTDSFNDNWRTAMHEAEEARGIQPGRIDEKAGRASERHARATAARTATLHRGHETVMARLQADAGARRQEFTAAHEAKMAKLTGDYHAQWQKLENDWKRVIQPLYEQINAANTAADAAFPPWQPELWQQWTPPDSFQNAARFARLDLDVTRFSEAAPNDPRLALPGPANISLPLVLTYPQQGSVLFETTRSGNERVFESLNNIIFRLLATTPAGKLSFTIIDPIKLGQNFSGVMHLADYEDNVLNGRIWTQANQIDERLADLNEHMEKVIQMYLRNEYETIAEYNRQAGNIAEKYHFVVVADFPANFTESAVRRLLRIAASGARCGVYTLIHWDHRHTAPPDFFPEELRKSSVCINAAGEQFVLAHPMLPRATVLLDPPPGPELATQFLHQVGESARGSNRVEVPFSQVAPPKDQVWSLETTDELRVPIGRSGATKLQYLAVGKGTRQHTLIAGKTGSGKSTLFHVMITNLALWCSPEQVEFYLIDFKKGVEFKGYATHRLPHARVVAIESDREFGLSVLQRLDEELKRRGELFRQLGVQDLAGYKKAGGKEPMPRSLLMIDEFQEFFVEDDRISQGANLLLDRIVRQGRAFGIHVLLGSQTLGGAYTLARTTIGQMVIRIALQCNEADAYLIMDENNPAPRLLSRPGEGIYNDMAGMVEGNSPFQAVWIGDDERDEHLRHVRRLADAKNGAAHPGPIVFEGNAPADAHDNIMLRELLASPRREPVSSARVWLGAPNSIKGPTEAVFQKRSGSNLLIVGQRDEATLAMLSIAFLSLSAQFPKGTVRFVVFESTAPNSPERAFLEKVVGAIPHETILAKGGDLGDVVNRLADDLKQRSDDEHAPAPATFLVIHGLQNFKKFRQDDDFGFSGEEANPAAQLQKLIAEGPSHGIHVLATIDTYNNVNRFLGRKGLSEFEMRVLFQMSTNDSASLCDDPKASTLGLHRALLYNEQEGYLETFRPYALPPAEWIEDAAKKLK
jgi:S-DNA-T family DNA segregation ATPase FtsK/SpoIIIE